MFTYDGGESYETVGRFELSTIRPNQHRQHLGGLPYILSYD